MKRKRQRLGLRGLVTALIVFTSISLPVTVRASSLHSHSNAATDMVTIADTDTPVALDPTVYVGEPMIESVYNCYDTLTRYKTTAVAPGVLGDNIHLPASQAVAPSLATSWEQHGLRLRFHLRHGVYSPYGHELTSADVVYTFTRHHALGLVGDFGIGVAQFVRWKAVDRYTVDFFQSKPSESALLIAALPLTSGIFDSVEMKKHATASDPWARNWLKLHTAGFGPYYAVSAIPGQKFVFAANPRYWRGAPKIKTVQWLAVGSASDRVALLRAGTVDVIQTIAPQLRQSLRGSPGVVVKDIGSHWSVLTVGLTANLKHKPLQDVQVRQAMAYLLPNQDILNKVYYGEGTIRQSMVAPGLYGATKQYWHYPTNVAKAKQLLRAAGVPNGFSFTLTFDATRPQDEATAALIQSAYAQAGIRVTLSKQSPSTYSNTLAKRSFDVLMTYGGPLIPDADYELALWYKSTSFIDSGSYINHHLDDLIAQAGEATNPARYVQLVQQAQAILERDQPRIGMVDYGDHYMFSSRLKGFFWRANTGHYDWYQFHF